MLAMQEPRALRNAVLQAVLTCRRLQRSLGLLLAAGQCCTVRPRMLATWGHKDSRCRTAAARKKGQDSGRGAAAGSVMPGRADILA
jgi:hypothetical protein